MTAIPLLGLAGWGAGIVYLMASMMFGLPFGVVVFLIGTAMMLIGLISLIVPSSRFDTFEEDSC